MCPQCSYSLMGQPCASCGNLFHPAPAARRTAVTPGAPTRRRESIVSTSLGDLRYRFLYCKDEFAYRAIAGTPTTEVDVMSDSIMLPATLATEMAKSFTFMPFISLLQPMSNLISEPPKDAKIAPAPGHFWMGQKDSLGASFDAICIGAVPHAIRVDQKKVTSESFEYESKEFQDIKALDAQRFELQKKGIMVRWGADLLLYMPDRHQCAVYFLFGTARASCEVFTLNALTKGKPGKMLQVRSKFIKNEKKNHKWYVPEPVVLGDIPDQVMAEMPDLDAAIENFKKRKARTGEEDAVDDGR